MAFTVRILATNLDGLEYSAGEASGLDEAFCSELHSLQPDGNVLWVAFSGRSKGHARRRLLPFGDSGRLPDFLILRHSRIYRKSLFGYVPSISWNVQILARMILSPVKARRVLDEWYENAVRRFDRMRTLIRTEHHLRMRFDTMENADAAMVTLEQALHVYRHLRAIRKDLEIEVRPVPFIRGLALRELCEHVNLMAEDVLTIVHGRSDLSLVDKSVSAYCGCSANADPHILHAVHDAGGHVARSKSLGGGIEVMRAYRNGQVCSDLPSEWRVRKKEMSLPERPWSNPRTRRLVLRSVALLISLYLILAVFATFDLVPLSGLILKPCKAVASGIGGLLELW